MPSTAFYSPDTSKVAIFGRLCDGEKGMTLALARELVKLKFSDRDRARMHELLTKNSASTISREEETELDNFVLIADMISSLQSRARMALKAGKRQAVTRG